MVSWWKRLDLYMLALVGAIIVAALLPATGAAKGVLSVITTAAICLLFFLYGARLPPRAVLDGILHWRLQTLILGTTFILFPILGLGLRETIGPWLTPELATGLVFVCLLPSTVQSSIAFTGIAGGNVAAALCAAALSNIVGVLATPALVALVLHAEAGLSLDAVESIAMQLLAPFVAGQILQPWIGDTVRSHKRFTGYVDRGTIVLIVYAAFSAGMVEGIWSRVDAFDLAFVALASVLLLAAVLVATTVLSRALGFKKADEIAIVFCGSKKSMASGIPMANVLFPAATVGLIVLPLMLFHQIQLFACAALARRYAARAAARKISGAGES